MSSINPGHPTVTLAHPHDGWEVPVDVDMAQLVTACWRIGINTMSCCQESAPGMAELNFPYLDDMGRFYEALTDEHDSLYFAWKWDVWPNGGVLNAVVHFPVGAIGWVTERLLSLPVDLCPDCACAIAAEEEK